MKLKHRKKETLSGKMRPNPRAKARLLAIKVTALHRGDITTASLAAIVSSSDDAIIGKDLNGIITSWNKGAEHLFGYAEHQAIGEPITVLIPQDRQQEEVEMLERLRRRESLKHFETIRCGPLGFWQKSRPTINSGHGATMDTRYLFF